MLKNRMKLILELTGLSQAAFSELFNISDSYMSLIMSGKRQSIGNALAKNICNDLDIEIDWLLEGKGKDPSVIMLPPPGRKNKENQSDYVTVNIMTLAGNGSTHDEDNYEPIDTIQFERTSVTIDGKVITRAVKAEGDSMYPTIVDGGIVGIDFEDKRPIDNGIFLIRFPDIGIAIKRLQLKTNGMLAVGDNAQVEPELIPKDILRQGLILGRVRWIHNKV